VGQTFDRNEERVWSIELEGTFQPLDDEDIADDGALHAGDWTQFQLGVRRWSDPAEKRHWVCRGGFAWFRAAGEPNIVQERGDYVALYAGFGFETRLTKHFSMGPELTVMAGARERARDFVVVPQINWHFRSAS